MKIHTSNRNTIFTCKASAGIATVMGNEVTVIRDFFKGIFPKDYFKSYYVDTKLFSNELEYDDVFRKNKPILMLRPRIVLDREQTYLGRMGDFYYKNFFIFRDLKHHYVPILGDEKRNLYVYALPTRVKIDYDIEMVFSTYMDAINAAMYFKGSVLEGSYFKLDNIYMEVELPRTYVLSIAKILDLDLNNPQDSETFYEYMNIFSRGYVTRKKNLASGNYEYYYLYNINILCKFEDSISIDDGEQNNQVNDNYKLSTTLSTEFTCPLNFFLEYENIENKEINVSEIEDSIKEIIHNENKVVLNYTYPINQLEKSDMIIEKEEEERPYSRYVWQGYLTDTDTNLDQLNFKDAIPHEMYEVVRYNNEQGRDNDDWFEVHVYKENERVPSENIKIEWKDFILNNFNVIPESTYYFAVYCDITKVKEEAKLIRKLKGLE